MKLDEVPSVLDVHPPHHAPNGARDFFLHLFTITIGLLIALSLEGLVEWQHHKHLAHDAETNLNAEIASNAADMPAQLDQLHKTQAILKNDVALFNEMIVTGKHPEGQKVEIGFHIEGFESVSWQTAQTTGALAYMPYDVAQQYSDIYSSQKQLQESETVATRDTILALRTFINAGNTDKVPPPDEIKSTIKDIETLQGQLLLVDSFMQGVAEQQKQFLKAHPK